MTPTTEGSRWTRITHQTHPPPESVRRLAEEFRDGLFQILKGKLIGAYLLGSVAFPGYNPVSGDIDFFVIIRERLDEQEFASLEILHSFLSVKFEFGEKLDGYYLPLAKAQGEGTPKNLVYSAHGRMGSGRSDSAWALHREHFYGSAFVRLQGRDPKTIFRAPDVSAIRSALYREFHYAKSIIDTDSWWAILSLCRLMYTFEKGKVVVSKVGAARWAMRTLPKWRMLIRSAIRTYQRTEKRMDQVLQRRRAREFLGFATVRIIAFDTTWESRPLDIAYVRNGQGGEKS